MGNRYEAGLLTTASTAVGTIATLVTASTSRAVIREIGVSMATVGNPANAAEIWLGYPAANGATASGSLTGQALDKADTAAVSTLVPTWTTKPTAPSTPLRRFVLPGVAGAGVVWSWEPNEFIVPVSSNLVIYQNTTFTTTGAVFAVYMKWSE